MKKILILNGTTSEIPIIKTAQEMGYFVVTSGNMPELPGHKVSDEYIYADYSDCEAVLQVAKDNGIEGIISCANDFGVITASYVAEKMGWPGHDSYENSILMHQKDRLMDYFIENDYPTPWFEIFDNSEDAKAFVESCSFPVIIKPNDMTGGKGVNRADNRDEAFTAIDLAFDASRDKHVLIEKYLQGKQQSIVVFLINRRVAVTSSSDIFCMKNPYLVQAETYPASDFELVKDKLREIIHRMASDLELCDGIFSFQFFVEDGEPFIIDMMRRSFGNEALSLADEITGFPWEKAYIMSSLGIDCSELKCENPTSLFCGHYGIMADRNGVLKSYSVPLDIRDRMFRESVIIHPGERIKRHMFEKVANIYFRYDDPDQMREEVQKYNEKIKVEVE